MTGDCVACGGRGFVVVEGDYKSAGTGNVAKNVEKAEVCPYYVKYFQDLLYELGLTKQSTRKLKLTRIAETQPYQRGCGAAIRAHERIRETTADREAREASRSSLL